MDKEYLEDYEQKERSEYERFLKSVQEGKFSFKEDRFPPDERFLNLQKPVAYASVGEYSDISDLWAEVPFSGSLIIPLPPYPQRIFEEFFFETSKIPKIIDFIKETGRLQVVLNARDMCEYVGLDHLDPFFKELSPPAISKVPVSIFESEKETLKATDIFYTLMRVGGGWDGLQKGLQEEFDSRLFQRIAMMFAETYVALKLGHYAIIEDIDNLMIDDPEKAFDLLVICGRFIINPIYDTRSDIRNFTLREIRSAQHLPVVYRLQEIRFPCEIGKFLLKKLTFAPHGLRACNELIDEYDAYDLRNVAKSLNDAITTNHPDVVNKNAEDLSEILDNVWNDKTISKRVENIKIGVPISIAAIGSVAGGLTGGPAGVGTGGFLAGLGFKVAEKAVEKFFGVKGEGLSEKLAKLRAKSYQANVYDFKKKYKGKIAHP